MAAPKVEILVTAKKDHQEKKKENPQGKKKNKRAPRRRGPRREANNPEARRLKGIEQEQAECLADYWAALQLPTLYSGRLPCDPSFDGGYTIKYRSLARYEVVTPTTGYGFFVVNPYHMVGKASVGNVWYSAPAYADTTNLNLTVAGVTKDMTPTRYNDATEPSGGFRGKVVASGFRIVPTGKVLDTAGQLYFFRTVVGQEVNNLLYTDLTKDPRTRYHQVAHGRQYHHAWIPRDSTSDNGSQSYATIASTSDLYEYGVFWTGCDPNFSFHIEIVQFWEYYRQTDFSEATVSPVIPAARVLNGVAQANLGSDRVVETQPTLKSTVQGASTLATMMGLSAMGKQIFTSSVAGNLPAANPLFEAGGN